MKRLAISVEGGTEREFVNRVLRRHLFEYGWSSVIAVDMRGRIGFERITSDIRRLLFQFDHVSTLYDFYGFQGKGTLSPIEVEAEIVQCLARLGLPDGWQRRVTPYVQVHEFEALVLSDVSTLNEWLPGSIATAKALEHLLANCRSPEEVNDSPETCPSRRIRNIFPAYDKKLHGPDILELTGLRTVRERCPRFDSWVSRLEALGSSKAAP